jgi:hypothetical protein
MNIAWLVFSGRATPRVVRVAAAVALGLAASTGAQAAAISWGSATLETGNLSDFVTTGTLLDAVNASPSNLTVAGITFAAQSGQTSAGGGLENYTYNDGGIISVQNAYNGIVRTGGSVPGGFNASYAGLVNAGYAIAPVWGAAKNAGSSILISNLAVGSQYEVQIFMPFWNANWGQSFSSGGSNASAVIYASTGGTDPGYITGTFTADAASQTIYINPTSDAGVLGAYQVRDLSGATDAPEPASLAMLASSLAALGGLRRKRRRTD